MSLSGAHQEYLLEVALMLGELNAQDCFPEPLPSLIDEKLMQLAEIYLSLTQAEDRMLFLELMDERSSEVLSIFAYRMAMLAVRKQSLPLLLYGLTLLALAVVKLDLRDETLTLSLLFHSGQKLGKEQDLFTQVAAIAPTPDVANWLLSFLRRRPEDQQISVMGFKEFDGPHGLIYQFERQPVPEGWM